ncbi:LysR substrate-binding domain-containing protein, partial [Methylobacterium sp. C33D]
QLSMWVRIRGQTVEALRGYEIDFAPMGRPPRDFPIEAATFGPHPIVLIAPPGHPLASRTDLNREDLADQPFFLREEGSGTRMVFEEFMTGVLVKRA